MLNVVTAIKAIFSAIASFFEWKHDEALREDGAREAELESMKREKAKVDAAIAAGNDHKRVHVENDPQDRATRRKI